MTVVLPSTAQIEDVVRAVRPGREDADPHAVFAAGAWTCLVEGGDGVAGALVQALGPAEALRVVGSDAPPGSRAMAEALARWAPRLDVPAIGRAFRNAAALGVRLVLPGDDDWPPGMDDLGAHAPIALWALGRAVPPAAYRRSVALVGSRAASKYGERVAADGSAGLADRGFAVVSGGALGIDGIAHRAALVSGGLTVAVLAGGLDRFYPQANQELLHRIAREGLVLSEMPCGTRPATWRFKHRNRLIAAIAAATVVVEAAARSGAANTAAHAAELGRPLGAVPGSIYSASSVGCHTLMRDLGAIAMRDAADMAALAAGTAEAVMLDGLDGSPQDPAEARVLDVLAARPLPLAAVTALTGLGTGDVRDALTFLALDGRVQETPSGWRRS